jgi:hypothetical protein
MVSSNGFWRRAAVGLALIGLAFVGCSGASPDQPELAKAPEFQPGPAAPPPKIPNQKKAYGSSSTYQKYMATGGKPQ